MESRHQPYIWGFQGYTTQVNIWKKLHSTFPTKFIYILGTKNGRRGLKCRILDIQCILLMFSKSNILCEIWSSHNGVDENSSLVEYDSIWIGKQLLTFQCSFQPSSSSYKQARKPRRLRQQAPKNVSNYLPSDRASYHRSLELLVPILTAINLKWLITKLHSHTSSLLHRRFYTRMHFFKALQNCFYSTYL